MAFVAPESGEGGVSMGPMVAVCDAGTVAEGHAIIALLEAHEIPALLNAEVEGTLFPVAPGTAGARVLVPSKLLSEARAVVGRPRERVGFRGAMGGQALLGAPGVGIVGTEGAPLGVASEDLPLDEEETGPLDLVLPEPGPLAPRLSFALLVIGLGVGAQKLLELHMGRSRVFEVFAARASVDEQVWRLVTGGVLHMSLEHFLSNAAFGALIGVVLFGTHRIGATALVWLLSSIVGLATEAAMSPEGILIAGASAGNYGLVGLWAKGQLDRARRSLLPRRELIRTIGILLLLAPGALTPISSTGSKVAVLAHLGGFLAGFVLGLFFRRQLLPWDVERIRGRSRLALAVAIVLILLCALAAYRAQPGGLA